MVEIIRAKSTHLQTIHDLAHVIWPDAFKDILSPEQISYMLDLMYSTNELQGLLEKEKHQFSLAFDNKVPVGFALHHPKEACFSIYRLSKIYIHPSKKGKGIGKEMIDYIVRDVVLQGASILELNVNKYNQAVGFYKKLGFNITGEEDIDIGGGYYMNDYIMQLPLKFFNTPVDEFA